MPPAVKPTTDIDEVRTLLLSMISDGRSTDAIELVVSLLENLRDKNSRLELRLRKLLRDKYGRKSEGISTEQLSLLLGELSSQEERGPDDESTVPLELPPERKKKKRKVTPHGRRRLSEDLEREEIELKVEGADRVCERCGGEKERIGHDRSEVIEFVPAHFKVLVYLREKLACKKCGDGVAVAPAANKVIERGLPGPGLLAKLLVDKYTDHLPLNRQAKRYSRLGVDLSRSTLSDWNGAVTDLLRPVAQRIRDQVLDAYVLGADGTHLKVLDKNHEANIKRGSLWCYVGDGKHAYFDYIPNERKEGPQSFLRERVGYIQADADPKLDDLFKGPEAKAIEIGCWMHDRRYWANALDAGDLRAAHPLGIIKKMYKVEDAAKKQRAGPDQVYRMRQEQSVPLLNELGKWIADNYNTERPTSPLAEAMGYTLRQWAALKRYTEDGRLLIDNGGVERAIRVVAMGRRNYLFAGSDTGGQRAAIAYTILGSCALAGINPWAYLRDVFEKLAAGWPMKRIEELLPAVWAENHPEHLIHTKNPAQDD
jgi:transposase